MQGYVQARPSRDFEEEIRKRKTHLHFITWLAAQSLEYSAAPTMGGCSSSKNILHGAVQLPFKGFGHGCEATGSSTIQNFSPVQLGVETPPVPGDVSLGGTLSACTVAALAPRYKSWLYLNPKGLSSHFHAGPRISNRAVGFPRDVIEKAGCRSFFGLVSTVRLEILDFFRPPVPPEQTEQLLATVSKLPRPLMIQTPGLTEGFWCSTGTRSSALLTLWWAKQAGHNAEAALRMAEDLKCLNRLMESGWLRDWLLPELQCPEFTQKPSSAGYLLEQFFDPATCSYTYLVACKATKEALLIDPEPSRTRAAESAALCFRTAAGLQLKYVLNTHCHYDHVNMTGSDVIKKLRHVRLLSSKESKAAADEFLSHGSTVPFGEYWLEVRETPGHTRGCLTYVLRGPDEPKVAFTGDALLVRSCGRTDFEEGTWASSQNLWQADKKSSQVMPSCVSPMCSAAYAYIRNAGQLYDSVHREIFSLDPDTQIFPGHEYSGRNNSTVGEEKAFNARLTHSREDFILLMDRLGLRVEMHGDFTGGIGSMAWLGLASAAEERKKGQLSSEDMNVALQRAEKHVREVFDKWAHDGRAECNRLLETLKKEGPEIYSQQEDPGTGVVHGFQTTGEVLSSSQPLSSTSLCRKSLSRRALSSCRSARQRAQPRRPSHRRSRGALEVQRA
eukprot:s310_g4.t1